MDNLSNKVKGHVQQATNMSMTDMVKGTTRLVGNTISLGFKAIGATVYVADKSVRVLGSVGKQAYDETTISALTNFATSTRFDHFGPILTISDLL